MKIEETITRNCCQPKDLKPVQCGYEVEDCGEIRIKDLKFCAHCGQYWRIMREPDPSGNGYENNLMKVNIMILTKR